MALRFTEWWPDYLTSYGAPDHKYYLIHQTSDRNDDIYSQEFKWKMGIYYKTLYNLQAVISWLRSSIGLVYNFYIGIDIQIWIGGLEK